MARREEALIPEKTMFGTQKDAGLGIKNIKNFYQQLSA